MPPIRKPPPNRYAYSVFKDEIYASNRRILNRELITLDAYLQHIIKLYTFDNNSIRRKSVTETSDVSDESDVESEDSDDESNEQIFEF